MFFGCVSPLPYPNNFTSNQCTAHTSKAQLAQETPLYTHKFQNAYLFKYTAHSHNDMLTKKAVIINFFFAIFKQEKKNVMKRKYS